VTGLEPSEVESVARPFRKRRRRWLLPIALLATPLTFFLVLLAFREQILTGLGEFLVVSDPLKHADLVYVLAGDFWGSRVLLGANLGTQGWAPKVVMSGGRYQDRYASDMAVDFAVEHGYPRSLFLPIRLQALSTIDEARAMGPIFHRLGAKRIILVTGNFHSRRAAQVFRLFLPEFDFLAEGSVDDAFHPRAWWEREQDRHLLFSEYQKMMGTFLVRFHLANPDWLRQSQQ
jgi:uncharacterized SAM-binding protein YcdF (DUF218 family)